MKTQLHEKFMRMAIELSEQNLKSGMGGPFGAVIVKGGELIAGSTNKVATENGPTAHAEIPAIRLACRELNTYDLSGCEIYTSCEPRPMCLGAIYRARIDKINYANTKTDAANIGFDDNLIYEEIKRKMVERKLPFVQLLRKEALPAFKLWQTGDFNNLIID